MVPKKSRQGTVLQRGSNLSWEGGSLQAGVQSWWPCPIPNPSHPQSPSHQDRLPGPSTFPGSLKRKRKNPILIFSRKGHTVLRTPHLRAGILPPLIRLNVTEVKRHLKHLLEGFLKSHHHQRTHSRSLNSTIGT